MAGGSLAERRFAHQHGVAHEHRLRESVAIRVPIDRRAAHTRHRDSVALDATVQVTAAAMLLVESPKIIKQGEHRAVNISPTAPGGDA
jgi:hypothetical protein